MTVKEGLFFMFSYQGNIEDGLEVTVYVHFKDVFYAKKLYNFV